MINAIIKIVPNYYTKPTDIDNTVSYIYRIHSKKPLPVYCYGAYPHTVDNIINNFKETMKHYPAAPDTYLWHFIISFPNDTLYDNTLHLFADLIAKLFSNEYQICYACHQDTDNLHFHYIVSSKSYIEENMDLNNEKMNLYLSEMSELANNFGISLIRKE